MNTKIATTVFLSLALATPVFSQGELPWVIRPGAPSKSEDLVESPTTNVVNGAFGYTLGAIWDGQMPEDAVPDNNGEVSIPVKPKEPFPPFESVTLSVSTNGHRIVAIRAETPRMTLAESYTETLGKVDEIVKAFCCHLGLSEIDVANIHAEYRKGRDECIVVGKLYREFHKNHSDDPDFEWLQTVELMSYRLIGRLSFAAYYYYYVGDTKISFSLRDVEHANTGGNSDEAVRPRPRVIRRPGLGAAGGYRSTVLERRTEATTTGTQTNSSESAQSAEAANPPQTLIATNAAPVICGVEMGEKCEVRRGPGPGFPSPPSSRTYEIHQGGKAIPYSCYEKRYGLGSEMLFNERFSKKVLTSVEEHLAFGVELLHNSRGFEAKENEILSTSQLLLSENLACVLKGKYGEPVVEHGGDNRRGERKWFFERDGVYVTLSVEYWSSQNSAQKALEMRDYCASTTIEYIYLPALEAAMEEGRQFLSRPSEVDAGEMENAREKL